MTLFVEKMMRKLWSNVTLSFLLASGVGACSGQSGAHAIEPGTGGDTGDATGGGPGPTAGEGGTGGKGSGGRGGGGGAAAGDGSSGDGSSGDGTGGGGATGGADSALDATSEDGAEPQDAGAHDSGAPDFGGMAACPGNPAEGWTAFTDTYKVQKPYDLQVSDRFKEENGVYTMWVTPTDKPHTTTSDTGPRTEMRWSNWTTGERMWEGDVMFESPLTNTCIMQIHNVGPAIAVYLQVNDGNLRNGVHEDFLKGYYGKWFNLKVAFNPDTGQVRVWIDNCLMLSPKVSKGPDPNWYFKNGVYGCKASICRDHFKNIKFWKK